MNPEVIVPDWPAPARVRALVTTRALGDMKTNEGRARLRALLPADPAWIRQVHGTACVRAEPAANGISADAVYSKEKGAVCLVSLADCMPVLLAGGVIESAIDALGIPGARLLAWLGPAIGPRAYEVGEEVRAAFLERDARAAQAFAPTRPGHWLLDLYAVARQRLEAKGVRRVSGGTFCTYTQEDRFFSFRKNGASERMAAAVWLA